MGKVRVLFFVDRMRVGGIQMLLVDLFRHFDPSQIQCELLLLDDGEAYDLEQQVRDMGILVHKLTGIWVRKPNDYLRYCKAMKRFFQKHHDYNAVHMNSGPKNYFVLKYAKQYGIPVRIAHSHNTGFQTKSKVQIWLGEAFKRPLRRAANIYLACSDLAGRWMFGDQMMQMRRVQVLPNGVDLDRFRYSEEIRTKVRKELGITADQLVVGNVGRFTPQKNHGFLIEIFAEIHRRRPDAVLLLAGIGELFDQTKDKAKALGLQGSVRFLGFRSDVTALTQAMDVFLMPSLYEGFPVTAVEAQAAGLPCVFSDTITREAKILDQVEYVSLQSPATDWADRVLALAYTVERNRCNAYLHQKGYDIHDMADKLMEIYQGRDTE